MRLWRGGGTTRGGSSASSSDYFEGRSSNCRPLRVKENSYGGGSLDRGGLVNDPLLLAPNDMSDENS